MGISKFKVIKNWLSTLSIASPANDNVPPSPGSQTATPNLPPINTSVSVSVTSPVSAHSLAKSPLSALNPTESPSSPSPTSTSATRAIPVRKRIHSHSTYFTALDGSPPRPRTLSVTKPPKAIPSPRYPRSRLPSKAERPRSGQWGYLGLDVGASQNPNRLSAAIELLDQQRLLADRLTEEASKTVESLSSEGMSAREMFDCLVKHGCPDLTNVVDSSATSSFAIASGGYGDVWKGKLHDGTEVAIKVWRVYHATEDKNKSLKKAMRELYNWSKTDHESIHKLLGVTMFHDRLGMVSNWMENGNLREYLGRNPTVDRYNLCIQVARAVQYLHETKNMVHGDLKACNFLVSSEGLVKLTDFDHSIISDCTLVFSETTNRGGGTLRWMAPELVLETPYPNQRSKQTDIYALGMTILSGNHQEIMSGTLPYQNQCRDDRQMFSKLLQKVLPERTEHLRGIKGDQMWILLVQCWNHDPAVRPVAGEVVDSLQMLM